MGVQEPLKVAVTGLFRKRRNDYLWDGPLKPSAATRLTALNVECFAGQGHFPAATISGLGSLFGWLRPPGRLMNADLSRQTFHPLLVRNERFIAKISTGPGDIKVMTLGKLGS